jgi:Predicted dioxygenase
MAYRTTLVREPAVAGAFYPADPGALQEMVDRLLAEAPRYETEPAALIVPHAGYIYSGHVAAWGFRQLEGRPYDAVVVLGTNHVEPFFHEISVWARGAWRTPLGEIPIDEELADALLAAARRCASSPRSTWRSIPSRWSFPSCSGCSPGCASSR